jgi:hypothetical protein
MGIELKEKFICGKKGVPELCEDMLVLTDCFVAVIDGVTSKSDRLYDGKSGGRYGAELVAQTIKTLDGDTDCMEALKLIDKAISDQYGGELPPSDKRIQACAIIYSISKKQIWCYGDCELMINGIYYDHVKLIDTVTSSLRAFVIECYLKEGGDPALLSENDVGREAIMPFLKKQAFFANVDGTFGYPVLDGSGINESMVRLYSVSDGDEIILASDGYPRLCPTLAESEKALFDILEGDPLAIKENMQTKMMKKGDLSFDDRAYIRFTVQ